MIEIDGNYLEGGGQIVRTALALSMVTQQAFRVVNIRKGRKNPGLKPQHLTGIQTLITLSGARCEGAELGSEEITFYPKPFKAQKTTIDIGTAGSITLLLQSLLLPAIFGKKTSTFEIIGGTDVIWSPSIDYFTHVIMPHLQKYAKIELQLLKRGYYPKGGGKIVIKIKPLFTLENKSLAPPIDLLERGKLIHIKGVSHCSQELESRRVGERQAKTAEFGLKNLHTPVSIRIDSVQSLSTGSGITLWAIYVHQGEINQVNPCILGAESLGAVKLKAEDVGTRCVNDLLKEIQSDSAVDKHLADNLIPFLALFGGQFKTSEITNHTKTNMYVVKQFIECSFDVDEEKKIIKV